MPWLLPAFRPQAIGRDADAQRYSERLASNQAAFHQHFYQVRTPPTRTCERVPALLLLVLL